VSTATSSTGSRGQLADPLQVLSQVWGYGAFRGPQEAIVRHV